MMTHRTVTLTWRKMFEELFLEETGDSFETITTTLTDEQLDKEFDAGYGGGEPFTAWSEKFVYFPACYDGAEWIAYVSRNPDGTPTVHVGG